MLRRQFLKTSIYGSGVAFALKSGVAYGKNKLERTSVTEGASCSRVVIATRADVHRKDGSLRQFAVAALLDWAVENLFGLNSKTVWQSLFRPHERVGLKVNCLAGKHLSTHPELVEAIIERLLQAGVKKENIVIWDRRDRDLLRAGYEIETRPGFVRCIGNDRAGFTRQIFEYGAAGSQISNTLHEFCDAVINLPIVKDHGIVGISGSMKNFFGAINNPNKYHMDVGNPYVADVNMLPGIRDKHRLTICDALVAQYEGGPPWMPQWSWNMNSLIVATDRVAVDQVIWDIIEQKRAEHGLKSLKEEEREPIYIATAADKNHMLGTNDHERIEILRV